MTSTTAHTSTWTGMVPIEDTALAVTDTGGRGIPVIYLNGQFATQGYWRRVSADLGPGFRHITYDERARGKKSKTSADYSFEASVRDVDAVRSGRHRVVVSVIAASLMVDADYRRVLADGAADCGRGDRSRGDTGYGALGRGSAPRLAAGGGNGGKERGRQDALGGYYRQTSLILV